MKSNSSESNTNQLPQSELYKIEYNYSCTCAKVVIYLHEKSPKNVKLSTFQPSHTITFRIIPNFLFYYCHSAQIQLKYSSLLIVTANINIHCNELYHRKFTRQSITFITQTWKRRTTYHESLLNITWTLKMIKLNHFQIDNNFYIDKSFL